MCIEQDGTLMDNYSLTSNFEVGLLTHELDKDMRIMLETNECGPCLTIAHPLKPVMNQP